MLRISRTFSLFFVFTLLITLTIAAPVVHGDGPDNFAVPEKQELRYPNLGSQLDQLVAAVEEGRLSPRQAAERSPTHSGESLGVTIRLSGHAKAVAGFLEENGGDPRNVGRDYIEAYVPVTLLGELSEQPGVVRVRAIVPPRSLQVSLTTPIQAAETGNADDASSSATGRFRGLILMILRLLLAAAFPAYGDGGDRIPLPAQ